MGRLELATRIVIDIPNRFSGTVRVIVCIEDLDIASKYLPNTLLIFLILTTRTSLNKQLAEKLS
jgi:hypothetical protein